MNERITKRFVRVAGALFLLAALSAMAVRLCRHSLFYDETVHLHALWLMADGALPFRDFFFESPVFANLLLSPLMKALPEGGYLVVLFRCVAVLPVLATASLFGIHGRRTAGHWAFGAAPFLLLATTPEMGRFLVEFSPDHFAMAAAVGAFLLFAGNPSPSRVGWAAALCVLSVSFNPKYAAILAPGGAAFLLSSGLSGDGWKGSLLRGSFGAAAVLLLEWLLFSLGGISFGDVLRWGFLFPARYHAAYISRASTTSVAWADLTFLRDHWPLAVMPAAGIAGWLRNALRERSLRSIPAAALLAGALWFSLATRSDLEQYMLPILVSLCFFAPHAVHLFNFAGEGRPNGDGREAEGSGSWGRTPLLASWIAVATLLGCFHLLQATVMVPPPVGYVREDMASFSGEPFPPLSALDSAGRIDTMLALIPKGEAVAALWVQHPLFRRDVTEILCDENPSFSTLIPPGEREWALFRKERLQAALAARKPALLAPFQMSRNYPPEWHSLLARFLRDNADSYVAVDTRFGRLFIREDLARGKVAGGLW